MLNEKELEILVNKIAQDSLDKYRMAQPTLDWPEFQDIQLLDTPITYYGPIEFMNYIYPTLKAIDNSSHFNYDIYIPHTISQFQHIDPMTQPFITLIPADLLNQLLAKYGNSFYANNHTETIIIPSYFNEDE